MFINAFMRLSCMLHTKTYCLTFETDILCSIGVFKTLFYGLLSFLRPYENLWTLLLVHDQNNGHPPHTLLVHDHDLLIVRGFSSPKLLRLRPSGRRPHRFHHHGSNATLLPNSTSLNQTHWRWNVPARAIRGAKMQEERAQLVRPTSFFLPLYCVDPKHLASKRHDMT